MDMRVLATENLIGASHPTLTDTLNRLTLVEHNTDGTHHNINIDGTVIQTLATDSTSSTTGALKTAGGAGIAKALYVGTNAVVGGTLTVTGASTLAGGITTGCVITKPTITNYIETLYAPAAGAAFTVNLANGTLQKLTTNANCTLTLPSSVAGACYTIIVAYGGTHTLTFAGGSTIKWATGTAPAATSATGKFDIFSFICDGTNTYARSGGANF